jgi:hypothetical protein
VVIVELSKSVRFGIPDEVLRLTSCGKPWRGNTTKENGALDMHG